MDGPKHCLNGKSCRSRCPRKDQQDAVYHVGPLTSFKSSGEIPLGCMSIIRSLSKVTIGKVWESAVSHLASVDRLRNMR